MRAISIAVVLVLAAVPMVRSTAADPLRGHVETGQTVASPLLGHDIKYAIYLPPQPAAGTDPSASPPPLPVFYLLHGHGDTEMAWVDNGHIAATLDRLIAGGTLKPLAVVMPMADDSWYVDDARGTKGYGPMATAFAQDFLPAIEGRYHLASCRSARAVGGLSMGGYGAVLQAFIRPDLYSSAISLSGSLFSDRADDMERGMPFFSSMFLGIHGDPFDPERFRRWTVFSRLEVAPADIKTLGVWLAAGDFDFPALITGTVRLHQELRRRKIETHLRIYDGEHNWALWSAAIEPALAWLSPRLDGACPASPPSTP